MLRPIAPHVQPLPLKPQVPTFTRATITTIHAPRRTRLAARRLAIVLWALSLALFALAFYSFTA